MKKTVTWLLAAISVACAHAPISKDPTRDRANQSFQNLQQEEQQHQPTGQ